MATNIDRQAHLGICHIFLALLTDFRITADSQRKSNRALRSHFEENTKRLQSKPSVTYRKTYQDI